MRKKRGIASEQGVTLIELMVASAVGLFVSVSILYFVGFAGDGTNQLSGRQQLELETSIISELFTRSIRNGSVVCVNSDTSGPAADMNNVTKITIRDDAKSAVATFQISGDTLSMNGNRFLTAYLCNLYTPASHFKVFQNGKHAEFYLSMFKRIGNDTITYCQTIGDVRCRN